MKLNEYYDYLAKFNFFEDRIIEMYGIMSGIANDFGTKADDYYPAGIWEDDKFHKYAFAEIESLGPDKITMTVESGDQSGNATYYRGVPVEWFFDDAVLRREFNQQMIDEYAEFVARKEGDRLEKLFKEKKNRREQFEELKKEFG